MDEAPGTGAAEVARIIDRVEACGAVYQVNGGWGVDGLVGRQTRPHRDLDIVLDDAHETGLVSWLESRGYRVQEDWRPVRVELAGPDGRVDVHPMRLDVYGDGIQQGLGEDQFLHAARDRTLGRIGGRAVVVATAGHQRALRRGYPLRDVDRHDLAQLDRWEASRR
ncbi:nucleotidyltransferase domain-containing protein [Ornithinimicrobium cerasi]|uniref:Lincosamide nucleotidyltransferase A/C/D/E n=1 Tax=Ornithinimicrobium cerasi TaxID=2248773 RepID=A0A285VEC6_9MICO|nr:lincomycin resistance protein LmrB [Ornithinimicrobium cerasi]SOC52410.1 lincosamide nucleotidyltransferase A/C/D/E [Ornithinimicrobium cerasi]